MKIFTEEFLKSIQKILMDANRVQSINDICKKLNLTSPEAILMVISSEEFQEMYPCKIEENYCAIENCGIIPLPIYILLDAIAYFENTGNISRLKKELDNYKGSYACFLLQKTISYLSNSGVTIDMVMTEKSFVEIFLALEEACYGKND